MKKLKIMLFLLAIIVSISSKLFAQSPYWETVKRDMHHGEKGVKLKYQKAGWPSKNSCIGIYPTNPIKRVNMKRLHYTRNNHFTSKKENRKRHRKYMQAHKTQQRIYKHRKL